MDKEERMALNSSSVPLYDAHCHPTDTMDSIANIPHMNASLLTIMATRFQDQSLVEELAQSHGVTGLKTSGNLEDRWQKLVPSFGLHPWFSHQLIDDTADEAMSDIDDTARKFEHYRSVLTPTPEDQTFLEALPEPRPLSKFLNETERRLAEFPYALIGEVGLDKSFRLPEAWLPSQSEERDEGLTPGGREGRRLSPYRVHIDHQRRVLFAQLSLAARHHRAASVHGVQAHGVLFEVLRSMWKGHENKIASKKTRKKMQEATGDKNQGQNMHATQENLRRDLVTSDHLPYPPRVCLHSYSGPVDFVKQYVAPTVPVDVYFSFSMVINYATQAESKTDELIRAVPDDRILIESDMHIAGAEMDSNLSLIASKICSLKGWSQEQGLRQLEVNWKSFVGVDRLLA